MRASFARARFCVSKALTCAPRAACRAKAHQLSGWTMERVQRVRRDGVDGCVLANGAAVEPAGLCAGVVRDD